MTVLQLQALQRQSQPGGTKGLPPGAAGLRLEELGAQGWNVLAGDVPLPACVLRRSALEHNRAVMSRFVADAGLKLAPHGKTTMAPQLFEQQLEDGVWGFTCATPAHLMTYRIAGVQRILYANQLVDPVGIAFVLDEMARDPGFSFLCLVDSIAGARILRDAVAARPSARPIDVLIEIGMAGRRCGVRTKAEALELLATVQGMAPHVRLRGVEAFEGVVSLDKAGADQVNALLDLIADTAAAIQANGGLTEAPIISVGGSAFFQLITRATAAWAFKADLILRSGCYIVNDHGMYERAQMAPELQGAVNLSAPLRGALEVWGYVQSRPEPGLIVATLGKRDISHDIEPPKPLHWVRRGERQTRALGEGASVVGLNDQHAIIRIDETHPIATGDLIALGCSHPCTTFDKWKTILVVDDDYGVVDAIATCF